MKKLSLLALLTALPLHAGSYTIVTTAGQDATLAKAMARANRAVCQFYALAPGCTQTQARREYCRRAGFGGQTTCVPGALPTDPPVCTTTPLVANCDGAAQVDVFTTVDAFLQSETVRLVRDEYPPKISADNRAAIEASAAAKAAACAAIGEAAGCIP